MDATIVTALAGIFGSLCGGGASVATAWVTNKTRAKREVLRAQLNKRETLYGQFIDGVLETHHGLTRSESRQAGAVVVDLRVAQPHPALRLRSGPRGSSGAYEVYHGAILRAESFVEEFHERVHNGGIDPLQAFSEACRREMVSMNAHV